MRRALGLDRETSHVSQATHSSNPSNGPHQRRHFARDGDVPVTMVHSDSGSRFQQLDAARQALRQQTAAREEAERLLADARNTIHDLETKLGHERLARDEVMQRVNAERLQFEEALTAAQEELAAERALRARQNGNATRRSLPRRLPNSGCGSGRRSKLRCHLRRPSRADHQPPRRRGRPPKVARQDVAPRRFRDRGMVVAGVAGEIPVESRSTGGARVASPPVTGSIDG